jgi:hypothetical protein
MACFAATYSTGANTNRPRFIPINKTTACLAIGCSTTKTNTPWWAKALKSKAASKRLPLFHAP